MVIKNLIISALMAIASSMIFLVATTNLNIHYPWLLPVALFLVVTSNLIERKALKNRDQKSVWKSGAILLLLVFLTVYFANEYADKLHGIRETLLFKFAIAVVLFSAWLYDFRKRVIKNV
jgi:peptidoglycan/LPS O-acetylase OafA/YrhL